MALHLRADQPVCNILYVGFNQDHNCFSVGTTGGFRIYNCDPFKETFRRNFPCGGIGIVEMLFRCNILALVGGGRSPCFPPTKVMLWDDHQEAAIGELTFRSEVKAVKLRRDRVIVVVENSVYLYNFDKLELIHKYDTAPNPKGIVALSPAPSGSVLACPSIQKGVVRVASTQSEQVIMAHESNLSYVALNHDGTRLATASEKGTIIRIYERAGASELPVRLIKQVRRGTDYAEIYSICFSPDSRFLCVSSGKATIHVFDIGSTSGAPGTSQAAMEPQEEEHDVKNRKSNFKFFSSISDYFNSEWSFAWFKGPDVPCICAFGPDNQSIYVTAINGQFLKLQFDPSKSGECVVEQNLTFPPVQAQ
eukprot:TRINITY_DN4599_c0_g2_i1.p1 TRINITY_DN4599_c0_g2~~TRINITY_DN4599_c0_g2_i1.p1  ORF type:complete len:372 (-),score=50.83 TRINITY_DN4599_c0_g2_i1:430-1521(-)